MMRIFLIAISTLLVGSVAAAEDCYSLHKTTDIVGLLKRSNPNALFSPYGFPVHPFYMCDDPIWVTYAGNRPSAMGELIVALPGSPTIHDSDLTPDIYVKLTGELEFKGGLLFINVFHVENVDEQVMASLAAWRRACSDWQDGQIRKTESESTYWSNMLRLPGSNVNIRGFGKECGIQFFIKTPDGFGHSVTIMRPTQ
jgi:hypothetical protein